MCRAPGAQLKSTGRTSWYEVYFTTPRYPDKPEYLNGSLDEKLVAFINTPQQTLDLADYDFDLENVAHALAEAKARACASVWSQTPTPSPTTTHEIVAAFEILEDADIIDRGRPARPDYAQ